jgi:hypothetical protein
MKSKSKSRIRPAITAALLKGFKERVARDLSMLIISQKDDGIFFDPAWQDSVAENLPD